MTLSTAINRAASGDSGVFSMSLGLGPRGGGGTPFRALMFSDSTPLQFSDGSYLEFSA